MSDGPHVTLPSPLPWRLSFNARVTSFNGDQFDLAAGGERSPLAEPVPWGDRDAEVVWEAEDLDADLMEGLEVGQGFPSGDTKVRVTLEPIR